MAESGRRRSERLKSRTFNETPIQSPNQPPAKKRRQRTPKNTGKWTITPQPASPPLPSKDDPQPPLNDECFLKLFEHLDLKSLCSMADVSKHFRALTKRAFADHFNELTFNTIDRVLFRRVMRKFGDNVSSISFTQSQLAPEDVFIMTKYCIKLERLWMKKLKIDCSDFTPLFTRLNYLCMDGCELNGDIHKMYDACTALEQFSINVKNCFDAPKCLFPNLIALRFECGIQWKRHHLWQLLQVNTQIQRLYIEALPDDDIIANVVACAPQLEVLFIEPGPLYSQITTQSCSGLLQLANLASLKQLSLHTGDEKYNDFANLLAKKLAENHIDIEFLGLESFKIDRQSLLSILKLRTLKTLVLVSMEELDDFHFAMIGKELTLLEQLRIDLDFRDETIVSINSLANIILNTRNLTFLALNGVRELSIDQERFEALVALVQLRETEPLKIVIRGCSTTTDFIVPQHIQSQHRSILQIDYHSDEDDACACHRCEELISFK